MISDTKLRGNQKYSPHYQMIQKEENLSMKMITQIQQKRNSNIFSSSAEADSGQERTFQNKFHGTPKVMSHLSSTGFGSNKLWLATSRILENSGNLYLLENSKVKNKLKMIQKLKGFYDMDAQIMT